MEPDSRTYAVLSRGCLNAGSLEKAALPKHEGVMIRATNRAKGEGLHAIGQHQSLPFETMHPVVPIVQYVLVEAGTRQVLQLAVHKADYVAHGRACAVDRLCVRRELLREHSQTSPVTEVFEGVVNMANHPLWCVREQRVREENRRVCD